MFYLQRINTFLSVIFLVSTISENFCYKRRMFLSTILATTKGYIKSSIKNNKVKHYQLDNKGDFMNLQKVIFLVSFFIISLSGKSSFSKTLTDCQDMPDNASIGMCLDDVFKETDIQLNLKYQKLVSKLKTSSLEENKELLSRLVKAQRAWITFKETTCELEGMQMYGGSGQGLQVLSCLLDMTEKRIEDLNRYQDFVF